MMSIVAHRSHNRRPKNQKNEKLPAYIKRIRGFETVQKTAAESQKRQKALLKAGDPDSLKLAAKLANCEEEQRCGSPACPVCFREHRIEVIGQVLRICRKRDDWRTFTLVYYTDQLMDRDILSWDLKRLKERLRKQLKRAGFQGPVVGGFEMDYHEDSGLWMPHFHLLVKWDKSAERKLRQVMTSKKNMLSREGVINRPMMVRKLRNRPVQVSYLYKSIWTRIEVYPAPRRQRNTKKYRLRQEQFVLSLKKLDQIGFAGLEFLYGIRRCGSRLQVNCP